MDDIRPPSAEGDGRPIDSGVQVQIRGAVARVRGRIDVTAQGPSGERRRFELDILSTAPPCPDAERRSQEGYAAYRDGRTDDAEHALVAAIQGWTACGRLQNALKDLIMRVHLRVSPTSKAPAILGRSRYADALALLDQGQPHREAVPSLGWALDFYRGDILGQIGDVRGAVRHLSAATESARRLGIARGRLAQEKLLPILVSLGDAEGAERLAQDMVIETSNDPAAIAAGC